MGTLGALHLTFIALWGGVLACEALLEFLPARTVADGRQIALLHYRIDTLLEAPVLAAIVVTGALLLTEASWSILLALKVAGALVAIGANVACIAVVVRRHLAMRAATGEDQSSLGAAHDAFVADTRSIHRIIYAFTPLGLAVFVLGLALA